MNKLYKIFTYGTLMTGEHNNYILKDSKYIGVDKIKGYSMYDMKFGFPFIINSSKRDTVIGEVWEVDYNTLQHLNMLEGYIEDGYDNHYDRVSVISQNGHECLVYVYKKFPKTPFIKCTKKTWSREVNKKHFRYTSPYRFK